MGETNIVYMAICFSGKRINIHATNIFEAAEILKKCTTLDPKDPEYVATDDVFQIIDIPG